RPGRGRGEKGASSDLSFRAVASGDTRPDRWGFRRLHRQFLRTPAELLAGPFPRAGRNTALRPVVDYHRIPPDRVSIMWQRNLPFLAPVGGGPGSLGATLLPPRQPQPVTSYDASAYRDPDFRAAVERVDAAFRKQWSAAKVLPAPIAPDLAIARRL